MEATAIILCLGHATRMRPLSLGTPKHLISFCLRPLLEYTLEGLSRAAISRIVIVAGLADAYSDAFIPWGSQRGLRISVIRRGLEYGSAGVLKSVVEQVEAEESITIDPLLLLYGDSLLQMDFPRMISEHEVAHANGGSILTVAYHSPDDLIPRDVDTTNYGVLSLAKDRQILEFREKPPVTEIASSHASAGVFLMDRSVVNLFPLANPLDFSADVIPALLHTGGCSAYGFDIEPGYRYDIGTIPLYVAKQFDVITERLRLDGVPLPFTREHRPQFTACSVEGTALIGTNCRIADSVVLRGTNIIASGVCIENKVVIEDCVVLEHARIGHAVSMKCAVVGPHSKVGDGAVLRPGSVVGPWSTIA